MQLLDYSPRDREVCAAIWLTAQITACPEIGEDAWIERYPTVYHELLPSLTTIVAYEDGAVESFLSLNDAGEIVLFDTAVCFQKKGHGSALLAQAKCRFPAGLTATLLQCNITGRAFLEKAGFHEVPDSENDCGEIRMVWPS